MKQRNIKVAYTPKLHPGFLGNGHLAAAVIDGQYFQQTDPFFLLMDDQLDLPGGPPVGGAHPHAGFETVTFVVDSNDKDWEAGSLELMTAGRGIVHTEEITAKTNLRILQLWLVLPPEKRWVEPSWQKIVLEHVPTHQSAQGTIRVYSGSSHGLTSPLQNHTPFTLVDFQLHPPSETTQPLPAHYNGFVYVLEGSVWVGTRLLEKGQVGWLDSANEEESELQVRSTDEASRFVLYAGQPHHAPIVSHGPFIADTQDDIRRLYREYRLGQMPHLNDLNANVKISHL